MNTQAKIRTYETNNNYYCVARIAKTTYEQRQEAKAEKLYMTTQKTIGIAAMILSLVIIFNGGFPAILSLLIGLAVTLTKDHVIG
jgi:Tfp pilus assembly protein PilF